MSKAAPLPEVTEVVGPPPAAPREWLDEALLRERSGVHLPSGLTRELWKYTPIRGFLDGLADAAADAPQPALVNADQDGIRATPLTALDDAQRRRVREVIAGRMDPARHTLADLSLLRARSGWLIEVHGRPAQPLEIRYPDRGVAPVFVVLAEGAGLSLVEHLGTKDFLAQVTHVDVARGARLSHYRAALGRNVPHYSLLNVRLARDAGYLLNQCCLGGTRRRTEVHVVLDGPGAEADLSGAYLVEDGQHLDQQLVVEHASGHTRSHQKFHGIGAGKGRSVFNGRIHIHPGAPQSDAQLSNKNLALHAQAEMNTKPELEIYTDDVRCAHGATVGQMDTDALFYFTARGIPEPEARRLLSHGFVRECMDGPLAETTAARFREALS